jgi:hypothetical protein
MKLETCFKLAEACGLETVGEAYDNIILRCTQIFRYEDIKAEVQELADEIEHRYLKRADLIKEVQNDGNGQRDSSASE